MSNALPRGAPQQGDPFKTLFIARLSYEVTERRLRSEFERFGPIKHVRLVQDKDKGAVTTGGVWLGGRRRETVVHLAWTAGLPVSSRAARGAPWRPRGSGKCSSAARGRTLDLPPHPARPGPLPPP
jgi:hypothetical protein